MLSDIKIVHKVLMKTTIIKKKDQKKKDWSIVYVKHYPV